MGRYIVIGAIIGSIINWIAGFTVLLGLVLGAIVGGIFYIIIARRNFDRPSEKINANREQDFPSDSATITADSEKAKENKEQTLQLREEKLNVKKERVQIGEVKVHKEVVEDLKTFTVPIKREVMVIEAGDEEEFRIPLKEEEVEINTHPVQINEVSITKRQIEEMKQIKTKLKKEIVDVDVTGDADVIKKPASEMKN